MSKQEFGRLDVLLRVQSGRRRVSGACVLIGLQRRQVFRLLSGLKQDGATSLLSKRRGRPSNHRLPAEVRTLALSIVRERYSDFGPSLAAEKLAEHHGCSVSRETLSGWMIADELWQDRRHRLPREIYSDVRGDGRLATVERREPASSDRLPVHRSESPTGYFSAGCSPAEAASASPVTDNSSSIPIPRGNQMRGSSSPRGCSPAHAPRARRQRQCHFYFARRVTFLSCADKIEIVEIVIGRRPTRYRKHTFIRNR